MKVTNVIRLKDGRKLGYAEYGNPQGKPLLYFHGWPGSRLIARHVQTIAQKLKLRIISVDRPGFGLSTFKKNRLLLEWPDDIVELADKLDLKKFAILGLSGGAPYVAACAYKIPKRITRAGIIVGVGPARFKGAFQGVRLINRIGRKGYRHSNLLTKITTALCLAEGRIIARRFPLTYFAKQERKIYLEELKKEWDQHRNQAFRQGIRGPALDLRIFASDWGFTLEDIKRPVFLWYGGTDRYVSVNMGKYYVNKIPRSKLTVYANEDHLGVLRNHAEEILETLIK